MRGALMRLEVFPPFWVVLQRRLGDTHNAASLHLELVCVMESARTS